MQSILSKSRWQMMDPPFTFSSNGDGFTEHNFLTGKERKFGLDDFPTKRELIDHYKQEFNQEQGLREYI